MKSNSIFVELDFLVVIVFNVVTEKTTKTMKTITTTKTMKTMKTIKKTLDKLPPWTLSIVCFLAICWLTLAPNPLPDNDIPLFPGADKIVHGIMFGGFTLCIIIDALRRKGWPTFPGNIKILFYSPDIPCAIGIITEFLQGIMHAGRSFELWDMVADITGAFLVAAAILIFEYLRQKK